MRNTHCIAFHKTLFVKQTNLFYRSSLLRNLFVVKVILALEPGFGQINQLRESATLKKTFFSHRCIGSIINDNWKLGYARNAVSREAAAGSIVDLSTELAANEIPLGGETHRN